MTPKRLEIPDTGRTAEEALRLVQEAALEAGLTAEVAALVKNPLTGQTEIHIRIKEHE